MDLKRINSLTKYPSIQTYHQLGERGRLNDTLTDAVGFNEFASAYIYEKVDGENSRIILLRAPDGEIDYLIGSREELLYAKGDRIGNPYGNIADFLKPLAEQLLVSDFAAEDWALAVIYQESYGGKTKASKNYSDRKTQSYRAFDIFTLKQNELERLLGLPPEKIAEWREHGHQPFYADEEKQSLFERLNMRAAPLLATVAGSDFAISFEDTFAFLKKFETTQVGIESAGRAEGIVVRTADRKVIRKIRFEDYERTFRK
ncbi:RNA ligase family protein [Saccharibacillus sacchari]|uniref:RNA ligase family protein n=1 Tax=Saccharibacillus sacchari TaxID=456493 RepID=A0ACC6PEU6_9BACL